MSASVKLLAACSVAVALLTMSGCSSWLAPAKIPELPLLPPQALGYSLQLSQRVEVTTAGDQQTLLAAWIVADNNLSFVGLTPSGQRLLSLNYDGETLTEHYSELLEQPLPGRDIIAYMQLAHWPEDSIEQALASTDWRLKTDNNQRQLLLKNHLVLTIDRQLTDQSIGDQTIHFPDTITMISNVADFQLRVRTVQVTTP